MPAQILQFISRGQLLRRRGTRNYGRWMMKTKGHVDPDGPEAAQWRDDALRDQKDDAEWAERHGPIEGGACIAIFAHSPQLPTQERCRLAERR